MPPSPVIEPSPNQQPGPLLTRRQVLTGALVVCLGFGGAAVYDHLKNTRPNNDIPLDPAKGDIYQPIESYTPNFTPLQPEKVEQYLNTLTDMSYLASLIDSLHTSTPEFSSARERGTVRQLLRVTRGKEGDSSSYGTAIQVDEGGVYITARHVVENAPHSYIQDPYSNTAAPFMGAFIHPGADIALAIAPTGLPPRPVEGIRLAFGAPRGDEQLTLVGLQPRNGDRKLNYYQKSGDVSFIAPDRVAIDGLVPLGGTSGSPIMNASGEILGIEAGFYLHDQNGPNVLSNYAGAIMTPLALLRDISQLQQIS